MSGMPGASLHAKLTNHIMRLNTIKYIDAFFVLRATSVHFNGAGRLMGVKRTVLCAIILGYAIAIDLRDLRQVVQAASRSWTTH
jgi:hypothetical protein